MFTILVEYNGLTVTTHQVDLLLANLPGLVLLHLGPGVAEAGSSFLADLRPVMASIKIGAPHDFRLTVIASQRAVGGRNVDEAWAGIRDGVKAIPDLLRSRVAASERLRVALRVAVIPVWEGEF